MVISQADRDALVQHAREDAPNECCGYARIEDGRVAEVVRSENLRHSPYGYNLAHYPDWLYVIVSLDGEPTVRAWRIQDGHVAEEDVVIG
jgi:hypothetical protein